MEERSNHITVVVGASAVAEELRRMLVRRKVAHAGVATHLRGLRQSITLAESDLMIVCIALDQPTINRHGESLRKLLADCHCFPQAVRSVGLLTEVGLTRDTATLGCDVYAHDSAEAARAVRLLARRWATQKTSRTAARQHNLSDASRPALLDAWVWGTDQMPAEFAPLLREDEQLVAGAAASAGKSRRSSTGASRSARATRRRSSPRHERD